MASPEDVLAKKIRKTYEQAATEVREKTAEFWSAHKRISAQMLADVAAGKITQADYKKWLRGQVFTGKRWAEKLKDITKVYVDADKKAREIIGGTTKNVFIDAANQTAYNMEKDLTGAVSFDLYDGKTVERLLKDNPKMLPEWKIDEPKDYVWNEKRVQNAVAQGIIQGESISDIGKRLTSELATSNGAKMDLFARTAVTGAQNAGRKERLHEAEEMGIEVKKQWIATHDKRTRDTHEYLDGQIVGVDEPFTVDGMEIDYPGDPLAPPELVYNCRCTLAYIYPKYQKQKRWEDQETGAEKSWKTFSEWKAEKQRKVEKTEEQNETANKEIKQEQPKQKEEAELQPPENVDDWWDWFNSLEDAKPTEEQEVETEIDNSYGQFGLKESAYPKELQYTKEEQQYINDLDAFWHDETGGKKDFDFNQEVSFAVSGGLQPTDMTFEQLAKEKEEYERQLKNAEEMIAERKAEGYKGASRTDNWRKWQALKQELRGADEFERGDFLAAARVGENGIRYWQTERKIAERKIKQIELAEKVLKRQKYAKGR